MYYIPRFPSLPASVTCDLCSLSEQFVTSILEACFFVTPLFDCKNAFSFRSSLLYSERRCSRHRLRMLNSAIEYEERYVEKELLGEGGFGKVEKETSFNVSTHQALSHLLRCIELNVERVVVLSQPSNWSPRERNRETALWQKSALSRTWPARISLGETVCFFLNLQYLQVHRGL